MSETERPQPLTVEALQERLMRAPYHRWLGLKAESVGEGTVQIRATWREEWIVNPDRRYTHGGILAALVDLAADWALGAQLGRGLPTIDMRVDYHRVALPGDLVCKGRVVRQGGQFSVAEAEIYDLEGKLCASGRGVYLSAAPK
jgi:uncharacterized protein (TIGR00369 family)